MKANEIQNTTDDIINKEIFIHNLADLLSQTKEKVQWISMSDNGEYVLVYFSDGTTLSVDIYGESYLGIAKVVIEEILNR